MTGIVNDLRNLIKETTYTNCFVYFEDNDEQFKLKFYNLKPPVILSDKDFPILINKTINFIIENRIENDKVSKRFNKPFKLINNEKI